MAGVAADVARQDARDGEGMTTRYKAIVVDPPWSYTQHWQRKEQWRSLSGRMFKRRGLGRGASTQYETMTLEQIAALPVGDWADDDAHIYVWTTNAFLKDAFPLLEGWGFKYKTMLTWAKPQIGMGLYFRNTTEHVLFGVRGRLKPLRHDVPTHFIAPRRGHSQKPEAFFDLVKSMSPGPYLDVFSRQQRLGWDTWGNECFVAPDLPVLHQVTL